MSLKTGLYDTYQFISDGKLYEVYNTIREKGQIRFIMDLPFDEHVNYMQDEQAIEEIKESDAWRRVSI